jgi:hypothetical protein
MYLKKKSPSLKQCVHFEGQCSSIYTWKGTLTTSGHVKPKLGYSNINPPSQMAKLKIQGKTIRQKTSFGQNLDRHTRYNYWIFGHYRLSCFFKSMMFQILDSASGFGYKPTQLGPIETTSSYHQRETEFSLRNIVL